MASPPLFAKSHNLVTIKEFINNSFFMSEKILWSLWTWEDKRDFTEDISWISQEYAKCFSNIKYNQKLVDNYSCTGQAACWVISDVTGFMLPLSFRKKVWEKQLETGAIEWKWDYTQNGMKQAVKLFNEEFTEYPYKLEYYRNTNIKNKMVLDYILSDVKSSLLCSYGWSLYNDAQDNWVVNNTDNKDWFGHAVRIVKSYMEDWKWKVVYCDNYEWVNKYTTIIVDDFKNNKDFRPAFYYIKKVKK